MGSPVQWEAIEQSVLADIESGLTLRQVASNHDISCALILKKTVANPSFREQYTRAMELRTEQDFEHLMDITLEQPAMTDKGIDPAWVNLKRLQVDTIKWALSKRNPKKYADRPPEVNLTANLGVQLVHAIPRPDKPTLNAPEPPIIDAEVS